MPAARTRTTKASAGADAAAKQAELEKKINNLESLVASLKKDLALHCKKSEKEFQQLSEKKAEPSNALTEKDLEGIHRAISRLNSRLDKINPRRRG